MKPDGFHLHLLAPPYYLQYNLSYCVSHHSSQIAVGSSLPPADLMGLLQQ